LTATTPSSENSITNATTATLIPSSTISITSMTTEATTMTTTSSPTTTTKIPTTTRLATTTTTTVEYIETSKNKHLSFKALNISDSLSCCL
jgi:hypothetical protein